MMLYGGDSLCTSLWLVEIKFMVFSVLSLSKHCTQGVIEMPKHQLNK